MTTLAWPVDPAPAPAHPTARLLRTSRLEALGSTYLTSTQRRDPVQTTSQAQLVTSEVIGSYATQHAPCLDVDHLAALDPVTNVLWVDATDLDWRATTRAFAAAGLADTTTARFNPRGSYVHTELLRDTLAQLGPDFEGTFEELLTCADALFDGAPTRTGAAVENPRPIAFTVPVRLLASTHNHHLYVEHPLHAAAYEEMLTKLAESGFIETGYLGASLERGATHLRLPWVKRDPRGLNDLPAAPQPASDPWATLAATRAVTS